MRPPLVRQFDVQWTSNWTPVRTSALAVLSRTRRRMVGSPQGETDTFPLSKPPPNPCRGILVCRGGEDENPLVRPCEVQWTSHGTPTARRLAVPSKARDGRLVEATRDGHYSSFTNLSYPPRGNLLYCQPFELPPNKEHAAATMTNPCNVAETATGVAPGNKAKLVT
jgi:hypothetical protein